jgi:hypothetical protein
VTMPSTLAYEHFGRQYRRVQTQCWDKALLTYATDAGVEAELAACVANLEAVINKTDVNIVYLAFAHILDHHLLEPLALR